MGGMRKISDFIPEATLVSGARALCAAAGVTAVRSGIDAVVCARVVLDALMGMRPAGFAGLRRFNAVAPSLDSLKDLQKRCGPEIREAEQRASGYAERIAKRWGVEFVIWNPQDIQESVDRMVACGQASGVPKEAVELRARQVWEKGSHYYLRLLGSSSDVDLEELDPIEQAARTCASKGNVALDEGRLHRVLHKRYKTLHAKELKKASQAVRHKQYDDARIHIENARLCATRGGFGGDEKRIMTLEKRIPQ